MMVDVDDARHPGQHVAPFGQQAGRHVWLNLGPPRPGPNRAGAAVSRATDQLVHAFSMTGPPAGSDRAGPWSDPFRSRPDGLLGPAPVTPPRAPNHPPHGGVGTHLGIRGWPGMRSLDLGYGGVGRHGGRGQRPPPHAERRWRETATACAGPRLALWGRSAGWAAPLPRRLR